MSRIVYVGEVHYDQAETKILFFAKDDKDAKIKLIERLKADFGEVLGDV